ncbi:MAG: [protein-PII] uridylyltransferase, partial [Lysobacter sp.]|nr:[protein-PII] uridylyltransferase [Lysobacter sp.]
MTDHAAATEPAASAPVAPTADWAASARATLAANGAELAARFDRNDDIDTLLRDRARAVDAIVREAWTQCIDDDVKLALFAVGGYGRGELYPQSDIDLLVLAEPDAQAAQHDALARFFALLWDAGLQTGHAVRSADECTSAARDDITVLTAVMEARPLVADEHDLRALLHAIDTRHAWPAREYFIAKREEQRVRHARFNDTADNLEPNLKEGPGGLRDIQTLRWMALRVLGQRDAQGMIALGQLGADEYATLERERRALARLRYGLHLVANRREERLRFDHQKALAARLGHVDDDGNLAVEQMMQGFYRSASVVLRINDRLLQRFEEQLEGEVAPEAIDDTFELRRGYLAARATEWPDGDTASIFALFATWAANPRIRGLHSQTARALAEALPTIRAYTDAPPALRKQFLALLRGPQAVETVARMARLGVLARWLPAFAQVSGRMQFDLF